MLRVTGLGPRKLAAASSTCTYLLPPVRLKHAGPAFDTLKLVRHFEKNGFTTEQSEAMVQAMVEVTQSSDQATFASAATKDELQTFINDYKLEREEIKKNLEVLEKTKVTLLQFDNDGLKAELKKLREEVKDEMTKLKSGIKLDFNLEKSRTKDEFSALSDRIKDAQTTLGDRIKDNRNKIDTEVAQLRTSIEQWKLDFFKYFIGACVSGASLTIAWIRLMK